MDIAQQALGQARESQGLPNWISSAADGASTAAAKAGRKVADAVPDIVANPIKRAGEVVADQALEPLIKSVAGLLELVEYWATELTDPEFVEKEVRKRGIDIDGFAGLRQHDLKVSDGLLTRNSLQWRTAGALEGGAMGAVALIPVPIANVAISITLDVVIVQVLSVAIASLIAYSYGFDAKDPAEQDFIERLVRRSFASQVTKAKPLNDVARAARAIHGRQRWSEKLLKDQRIIAATKKLLERMSGAGVRVPVSQVAKVLPFIGIVVGAGVNSMVLGNVADDAKRFCQTRFLCEKYGLPLPVALRAYKDERGEEPPHD